MDGRSGQPGSLLFRVLDPITNMIIDQGSSLFDLAVTSFQLFAVEDDGIFEPGESVFISNVTVTNTGGMILPPGTMIQFPTLNNSSKHPFFSSNMIYAIPQPILPGGIFQIPFQFYGTIGDVAPPNVNGPFSAVMAIQSSASLLTSPFDQGFLLNNYNVTYPIKIAPLTQPSQLGRCEKGTVTVHFHNISTIIYGSQSMNSERQHLSFVISFDPRFTVHNEPNLNGVNAIEEDIPLIHPSMTYSRSFQIELNDLAQFFETVPFKVSLKLRGKIIENMESSIRLTPNYYPTSPTQNHYDVLLFTGE